MAQITARPIWLPVLFESDQPASTLLGRPPLFAKGAEFRVYVSIFQSVGGQTTEDPGTLFDITNFISFIMKFWATGYGTGALKLDTSDAAAIAAGVTVNYNYNATEAQFWSRTAAQIEIYIPASVAANVDAGTVYGVFTGATAERPTQPDFFGNFLATSLEVGLSTAATPPVPASDYVRNDVFQSFANNVVVFGANRPGRYPIIVNPDGSYGTALRTGQNGEFIPEQISNP